MTSATPHAPASEQDRDMPYTPCSELLWLRNVAMEHELTASQIAVFVMLMSFREGERTKLTKAQLGHLVGLGERQVTNVLKELEAHVVGFIKAHRNGRAGNSYSFNPAITGNPLPETDCRLDDNQQSIAGNPLPVINPNQQPIAGYEILTSNPLPVSRAQSVDKSALARAESLTFLDSYRLELNPESVSSSINSGNDAKPVHVLNGSAKGMMAHELASKLIEVCDTPSLNARNYKLAASCPVIKNWMDDGADFDTDIVPTVMDLCSRQGGKPIYSWKFFTAAVRDSVTTRIALENYTPNPITAESVNDQRNRNSDPGVRRRARSPLTERAMRLIADGDEGSIGRVDSSAVR